MLGSASYLGLSLVCAHGTPMADMLAHSPPLPLIIDRVDKNHHVNAADDRMIFALRHRDRRVRRIRLLMPVSSTGTTQIWYPPKHSMHHIYTTLY